MTIRKLFVSLSLLSLLLGMMACMAVSEPAADPTAAALPTISEPTVEPDPTEMIEPEATDVPVETAVPAQTLDEFTTALQTALAQRDFVALQAFMSDPFGFGPFRSEWSQLTPAQMAAQLETLLPEGASVQFSLVPDLVAMLDGQDPQQMLGPDVALAAVWHSTGWGAAGQDEAILFVEELADGRFAWKAMILAPGGFLPESAELPIMDEQPAPVGLLYSQPDGSLWQVGADGQPQKLTDQPEAVPSPDGQHAVYMSSDDNFWLIDLASGEKTQLTSTADNVYPANGRPQWANNETILVGLWFDLDAEGGPNWGHPTLINIGSGELTRLDESSPLLMRSIPAFSETGVIAFDTVGRSANDQELNWIYLPGQAPVAFEANAFANAAANAGYTSPALSADGRFLAWLAITDTNVNHLAIFDLETGTVANLPAYQGVGFGGPYPNPVIGPDPNWIALRQYTEISAAAGLWLYTQDGQPPLFIAHNGGESLWVNDHLLLFLDYDENYNAQLQQYDVLTGVRSAVTLPNVAQIFGIAE